MKEKKNVVLCLPHDCLIYETSIALEKVIISRVAYRYSGTDRNRYSFRKEPVFTRFVENRY